MLLTRQNSLSYKDCIGLNAPDRLCHIGPDYSPNVVNQTVDWQGVRYKGNPGQGWTAVGNTGSSGLDNAPTVQDPIANAQKFLKFQQDANQPVIQQLQSFQPTLESKYKDLVSSIKGQSQVVSDKQTLATNNELGRRGILPTSGLYEQEQVNAQLPITSATNSQLANVGMGEAQDLQSLALEISRLQAGDSSSAISGALQYGNQVQQADQFSKDLFLKQQEQQQQASQFQQNYQLQQQQASQDEAYRQMVYQNISLPEAQKALSKTSGGSALKTSDYVGALNSAIGQKKTLSQVFNAFSPYLPASQIVTQYNALSPFGAAKEPWAQALVGNKSSSTDQLIQAYLNGE